MKYVVRSDANELFCSGFIRLPSRVARPTACNYERCVFAKTFFVGERYGLHRLQITTLAKINVLTCRLVALREYLCLFLIIGRSDVTSQSDIIITIAAVLHTNLHLWCIICVAT